MTTLGVDTSPLHPQGQAANNIQDVYTPIFWVSLVFYVGVSLLILTAAFRFRRRHDDDEEPAQTHGNTRLEAAWTAAPFVILAALFFITAVNQPFLKAVLTQSSDNALVVHVMAKQFEWDYSYDSIHYSSDNTKSLQVISAGADNFVGETADPLVIPAGRKVQLFLQAADVIHSFYVPTLGGQINAVPGQENHIWIEADNPGAYFGQCTELCGLGHAHMFIVIVALNQSDFTQWQLACTSKTGPCSSKTFQSTFHVAPADFGTAQPSAAAASSGASSSQTPAASAPAGASGSASASGSGSAATSASAGASASASSSSSP